MFLKVLRRGEPEEYYQLTADAVEMIADLESITPQAEYFFIMSTPGTVVLHRATIKAGSRDITREYELIEVEANGVVVGESETLK